MWELMPVTPTFQRLTQEDYEFEAGLDCVTSSWPARAVETLSLKK